MALAHLESESDEKDAEIAAANREIEELGQRIYELEEDSDELKKMSDRIREDEAVERDRLEALAAALKEVLSHGHYNLSPYLDHALFLRKLRSLKTISKR